MVMINDVNVDVDSLDNQFSNLMVCNLYHHNGYYYYYSYYHHHR